MKHVGVSFCGSIRRSFHFNLYWCVRRNGCFSSVCSHTWIEELRFAEDARALMARALLFVWMCTVSFSTPASKGHPLAVSSVCANRVSLECVGGWNDVMLNSTCLSKPILSSAATATDTRRQRREHLIVVLEWSRNNHGHNQVTTKLGETECIKFGNPRFSINSCAEFYCCLFWQLVGNFVR